MYTSTLDIKNDYKALLDGFVSALTTYNGVLAGLTDIAKFRSFLTSDQDYNVLRVLRDNVNSFIPKASALKDAISASTSVDDPIYAQYFVGSLLMWNEFNDIVNTTFENLTKNIATANQELALNGMEGLLTMIERDHQECASVFSQWHRTLSLMISDIAYIHSLNELDVTNFEID